MKMYCFRTGVMYLAMKGKNDRLKLLLDNDANMDLQTSAAGPFMDLKVPKKYTEYAEDLGHGLGHLGLGPGEDTYERGFT